MIIQAPVTLTSQETEQIEKHVLGDYFPWYRAPHQTDNPLDDKVRGVVVNSPFFCHTLMARSVGAHIPGRINSEYYPFFLAIFERWLKEHSISCTTIYRACLNLTYPSTGADYSVPHVDHDWPHNNWIMYLNSTDAPTYLFDDVFNVVDRVPSQQYQAVTFSERRHAQGYCTNGQRIVVVFTYI
jgi:hypothetical protein